MVLVHRPVPAVGAPVGGRAREPSQQKTKAVFLFFLIRVRARVKPADGSRAQGKAPSIDHVTVV